MQVGSQKKNNLTCFEIQTLLDIGMPYRGVMYLYKIMEARAYFQKNISFCINCIYILCKMTGRLDASNHIQLKYLMFKNSLFVYREANNQHLKYGSRRHTVSSKSNPNMRHRSLTYYGIKVLI